MADADTRFLDLGFQYYTAGRLAFLTQLTPITGSLFHHAIEMQIKARLSQTHTLEELSRKPFGHRLFSLWDAFKAEFSDEELDEFDSVISLLDEFEELRYPDSILKNGASVMLQITAPVTAHLSNLGSIAVPEYTLVLNDIDRLFARILQVSSRNPLFFISPLNEFGCSALSQDNPVAEFLLKGGNKASTAS